jgi:hypothetical protein
LCQVESKKALQQLNEEKDALVAQLAHRVEDLQALTPSSTHSKQGSRFWGGNRKVAAPLTVCFIIYAIKAGQLGCGWWGF